MVAAINQNFSFYTGDLTSAVFTVTSDGTTPVDISSVSDIVWTLARSPLTVATLTKMKSMGGIAFVTNGSDGKFKLTLTPTDTALLLGSYVHSAKVIDGAGNPTTCTVGAVQVGAAPSFTYDATALIGALPYNKLMQVRTLIADVNSADRLLWDEQILFAIQQVGNIYKAGADCCRQIAAKYSRDVDTTEGLLHRSYSARQRAFAFRAYELDQRAARTSGGLPYAGGISQTDKTLREMDTDRVVPQFMIGLTDNWFPVSPVDSEMTTTGPTF